MTENTRELNWWTYRCLLRRYRENIQVNGFQSLQIQIFLSRHQGQRKACFMFISNSVQKKERKFLLLRMTSFFIYIGWDYLPKHKQIITITHFWWEQFYFHKIRKTLVKMLKYYPLDNVHSHSINKIEPYLVLNNLCITGWYGNQKDNL